MANNQAETKLEKSVKKKPIIPHHDYELMKMHEEHHLRMKEYIKRRREQGH